MSRLYEIEDIVIGDDHYQGTEVQLVLDPDEGTYAVVETCHCRAEARALLADLEDGYHGPAYGPCWQRFQRVMASWCSDVAEQEALP